MNVFKKTLMSVSLIATLGASAAASAEIITDPVVSNPDTAITFTSPYTFIHNIGDNGFVIGTDTISEASLVIRLTDATSNEQYRFVVGPVATGQNSPNYANVANNTVDTDGGTTQTLSLNAASIADLSADGLLSVTVQSLANNDNFFFASSSLNVTFTKGTVSVPAGEVPEPATIALLGLGLLGFAASRRKAAKSKNA